MEEKKVSAIIKLSDVQNDTDENEDEELIVRTTVERAGSFHFPELSDKIKEARAEYISSTKSLKSVAEEFDINENILKKHCSQGKWNIIKRNPEIKEYMLNMVDEIYSAIDVYEFGKHIALTCMKQSEFQNPKDLNTLIGVFKICHDEISKMRVINSGNVEVIDSV